MKSKITLYLTTLLLISSAFNAYAQDTADNRKIIYKPKKTSEKNIKTYNDTSTIYKYIPVDRDAILLTYTEDMKLPKYIMSKIKIDSPDIPSGNVLSFKYNIDEEGQVKDLKFITKVTPYIEQQVFNLINDLKYAPAIKDNESVAMEIKGGLNFPFFKRPRKVEPIEGSQWMPEFIGGESEMYNYIKKNLVYPKTSDEGQSVIRFVISDKGKVKDVSVMKSSGSKLLDNAAKMVVARMPNWEPGLKEGKPISVFFTLPINFKRP